MENAVLWQEMEAVAHVSDEGVEVHLPNNGAASQYHSILSHLVELNTENPAGVWILNLSEQKDIPVPLLNAILYLAEQAMHFGCEIKLTGIGKSQPIVPFESQPFEPSPAQTPILPLPVKEATWTSSFGVIISMTGSEYEVTLHPF